jgi:hypothetical protein
MSRWSECLEGESFEAARVSRGESIRDRTTTYRQPQRLRLVGLGGRLRNSSNVTLKPREEESAGCLPSL